MSTVEEASGGFDVRRLALSIALALTVVSIGIGTWVLGSGADPVEQERASFVVDMRAPDAAQPPLSVAPLSASAQDGDAG